MYLNEQFLLALILFLSLIQIRCQDNKYEYSIEVPKYVCDNNGGVRSGTTTIRLLGKDAQKLQYDFSVSFRNVHDCKQRCTLMSWRAVRNLEKYIKNVSADKETLKEININNSMLVPGIQYVLNIAVSNKDALVDTKEFMLECTNETATTATISTGTNTGAITTTSTAAATTTTSTATTTTTSTVSTTPTTTATTTTTTATTTSTTTAATVTSTVKNETAVANASSSMNSEQNFPTSFTLIGANITYRDMLFILNAEADSCNMNCNYYYKWEILDNTANSYKRDYTKGSELQIPPDFFDSTEMYVIKCSLINGQNDAVISTALQNLKVLKRDMILKLSVSTLLAGIKKPFKLAAYFRNIDNPEGKINIKWSCQTDTQQDCLGFEKNRLFNEEKSNLLSLESKGLLNVGSYYIRISVTDEVNTKEDTCTLTLAQDVFVKIDIDALEEPIDPSKDIEVPAFVSGLIATCTLQWINLKMENYNYLNQNISLGNINVLTNVTLKEDEFLNEIDEFSNNSVDIEYNLKIPPPKPKDDPTWGGLEGNSSYLFRLNATCPITQKAEDNDEDAEPLIIQRYITAYADVIVHTDSLPILNALEVTPKQGIALKTLFEFIYYDNGSNLDFPILYKFGYFLKDEIVFISSFYGVTNTKGVLPYSNGGIKTVLEGCNSHSLCSKILGPVIVTEIPTISEQDYNNLMGRLRELMGREEYYKMFTYSLAILQTFNSTNNTELITPMENYISNLTSHEIKRLLMKNADGDATWIVPANNLIKNIGLLLNKFSASQILLNNIVALRNELSRKNTLKLRMKRDNSRKISRRILMVEENSKNRSKRDAEKMTLEEVKNYLAISELIITSSPDRRRVYQERQSLMNQIDRFMPGLCANLYYKSRTMNLELKTLILSVEKINRNSFNRYIHILFPENTWEVNGRIKLGKCFTDKLKMDDQLCLGKVVFKNYLSKKGFTYMVKIYDAETNGQVDLQEVVCDSVLILPVEEKQVSEKEAKCAFWKKYWSQSQCKTIQLKSKSIQCACTTLGYFSLEYITPTPSTTISSSELTTTSANQLAEVTVAEYEVLSTTTTTETSYTSSELAINITVETTTDNITAIIDNLTSVINTRTDNELIGSYTEISSKPNEISDNISLASIHTFQSENLTVHYFIIGTSLVGIVFLIYGIKRLVSTNDEDSNDDFPKYAPIYHEEMLQDFPQIK